MIPGFFASSPSQVPPPVATLYDLIIADSPAYYFRHGEASGLVMDNEVGTDGDYVTAVTLGSTALYSGGPTSVRLPALTSSGYGRKLGGTLPALSAMTLMTIVQFTSLNSQLRGLISCDDGGANRRWQWRMNGGDMQFVKIAGGVSVAQFTTGFSTGVPYMVHVTISSSGALTFYVDGVQVSTASLAAVDYGSSSEYIEIGFATAGVGLADAFFSESAIFASELSSGQVAAHASAAGF